MRTALLSSIGAAALALALAGPASAQSNRFTEFDTDKNGTISQSEYNAGVQKAGVIKRYDTNGDGMIDATEFTAAKLDAARYGDMSAFDANTDKMIDADEFGNRLFSASRGANAGTIGEGEGLTQEQFSTTEDIYDE